MAQLFPEAVHVGGRGAVQSAIEMQDTTLVARIEAERATSAANGRQIETEAAPIHHIAEPIGADTDTERAIRWLIALMVLCCDPPGSALTAAD